MVRMVNERACHGRVLVLWHSFVSRLEQFIDGREVELCGHRVMFCGVGGATVDKLRKKIAYDESCTFLYSVSGGWYR